MNVPSWEKVTPRTLAATIPGVPGLSANWGSKAHTDRQELGGTGCWAQGGGGFTAEFPHWLCH